MDDWFFYFAIFLVGIQMLFNVAIIAIGIVELGRPSSRRKYQGEDRMSALNLLAYSVVELGIGIILAKLFHDGTVSSLFVFVVVTATGYVHLAIKYFYSKRVPSPDSLKMQNRYIPNTTAQAYLEEAQLLSEKQHQPEEMTSKH